MRGVRAAALQSMRRTGGGAVLLARGFPPEDGVHRGRAQGAGGGGALDALAGDRRSALWRVEAFHGGDDLFRQAADAAEGGLSPLRGRRSERWRPAHAPLAHGGRAWALRPLLPGVKTTQELRKMRAGERVRTGVAGGVRRHRGGSRRAAMTGAGSFHLRRPRRPASSEHRVRAAFAAAPVPVSLAFGLEVTVIALAAALAPKEAVAGAVFSGLASMITLVVALAAAASGHFLPPCSSSR